MPLIVMATGVIKHSPLTTRERDVLGLCAKGLQQRQIALMLMVSTATVKKHLQNVYKKLEVHNKVQALKKTGYL